MALRRRLAGVEDISISQGQQRVEVTFAHGSHAFSPDVFRQALDEAGVELVTLGLDFCGIVEHRDGGTWLAADANAFRVTGQPLAVGQPACVAGRLNDRVMPHQLEVTSIEPPAR